MKTRPSKPEQKAEKRQDLKAIQEVLRKSLVTGEPFDYAARAQQVIEAQHWNAVASSLRFRPSADPQTWDIHKATAERFWKALDAAYPDGFWDDCEKLKAGNATGLESAVVFLEADPVFFRTGYLKTKLARHIKQAMLTPPYIKRLQQVILTAVDRRHDRDFRAYCNLARKADAPELRAQLESRLTDNDLDIRRRARWVLEALAQKDSMEKA